MGLHVLLFLSGKENVTYATLSPLLLPLVVLAIYFMVFVITPYDLAWHLNNSLDRVLLHLWPASVFILATIPVSTEQ